MVDHDALNLALRARLTGTTVCTTGTTSIAATATGFTRAAGSFLTDGFRPGMEVLAAGFATAGNNGYKVIAFVDATTMTVNSLTTMAVEAAGGDESIVCGVPATRLWENTKPVIAGVQQEAPTSGRPYVSEEYVPATHEVITLPAASGSAEETGLYLVNWFGLSNTGPAGIRDCVQAVLARFAPGTSFTVGSDSARVRTDIAPYAGQLRPLSNGWTVCQITVPWKARSTNLVAA